MKVKNEWNEYSLDKEQLQHDLDNAVTSLITLSTAAEPVIHNLIHHYQGESLTMVLSPKQLEILQKSMRLVKEEAEKIQQMAGDVMKVVEKMGEVNEEK
ncbi:hypothetical protein [Piscirickettsia litoralis]|uniref:Uncharacterized protein n=1 Tax=Piscirickettsia litoralis TaxID=1891921 RepID=A0ABX3A5Z8_9GAMM|nr:hypothetical protein [Piscirickettsia litoralis]ODN42865.1 hypothetical protein BGC07_07935 [Piscirickettsia litoralis]